MRPNPSRLTEPYLHYPGSRNQRRDSHIAISLVIPAGKPESRAGKAKGIATSPFPSSFRPGSRNPGQGELQGKPCRRFLRHSGREAGIQGRESNLAVTIGAKVARSLTLPGLGPGFPAGTTDAASFRPGRRTSRAAPFLMED